MKKTPYRSTSRNVLSRSRQSPITRRHGIRTSIASATAILAAFHASPINGQTFVPPSGTAGWEISANWNSQVVPNSIGAAVIFADPNANRTIQVNSGPAGFTVGSITFNNDTAFTNALQTGTSGSNLKLDNGGLGASLIFNGSGPSLANQTISAPMAFIDNVTAFINYAANSTATITTQGAFNWTGSASGPGGFTKKGPFVMTMQTAAKQYTGLTLLDTDSGRLRISVSGQPTQTSSVTVMPGAQIEFITAGGAYSLGPGPVILNGSGLGPTSAPGDFPGALRPAANIATSLSNAVVLQTDTLLHVQGAANGVLTLSGVVSGAGKLTLSGLNSDADLGRLLLSNDNIYTGGTTVNAGTLELSGLSASLGLGNVEILNAQVLTNPAGIAGAVAKLRIDSGVLDGIADDAILSLAGGRISGLADDGFAELQANVNERVGGLVLGGVPQIPGTYGSTASGAQFQLDEYFSGPGMITVVPEPGAAVMLLGGLGVLAGLRRSRRRK